MSHPDNNLRRKLWALTNKWNKRGWNEEKRGNPGARILFDCVEDLREALTYPAATEVDEQKLIDTYGKTSEELAMGARVSDLHVWFMEINLSEGGGYISLHHTPEGAWKSLKQHCLNLGINVISDNYLTLVQVGEIDDEPDIESYGICKLQVEE